MLSAADSFLCGTIVVQIGKNAENGGGIEKSFSVFDGQNWNDFIFLKKEV